VGALYRVRQFWEIVTARPLPDPIRNDIATILTEPEQQLFYQLSLSDQWHSYRVLQMLRDAGQAQPDLLAAALLHDVGKTQVRLTLLDRTLIVLAQALWPRRVAAWGQGEAVGWRRPFVVKMCHPQWSAAMAQRAGSRPLTLELIRRHQDKITATAEGKTAELLRLLQWADDQN
jgi:hypothetical protein